MSFNLYWVQNDGIGGHIWLSLGDLVALREEMLAQGMAWQENGPAGEAAGVPARKLAPAEREVVTPDEIEGALEVASPEPRMLSDRKLWHDWLAFLDGGSTRGGILIRP